VTALSDLVTVDGSGVSISAGPEPIDRGLVPGARWIWWSIGALGNPVTVFRRAVTLLRLSVAEVRASEHTVDSAVAGGQPHLALIGSDVPPVRDPITAIGDPVAIVGRLVTAIRGEVSLLRSSLAVAVTRLVHVPHFPGSALSKS
jgi:hypothetical protein